VLVEQILDRKGREVATVAPDAVIAEAVRLMADRNVGALVVSADGGTVDGILSERDVVRALAAQPDVLGCRVAELMVSDVATCDRRTDAVELMGTMTSGRFRHVPVVDDGRLAGIVSIGDVVKSRIDELASETQQLVGYIQNGR